MSENQRIRQELSFGIGEPIDRNSIEFRIVHTPMEWTAKQLEGWYTDWMAGWTKECLEQSPSLTY